MATVTTYKAMCSDCSESLIRESRLEANRDAWADGHRKLTARMGEPHYVATYEWKSQS